MSNSELDDVDRSILRSLQSDATLSSATLSEMLSLTVTACWRRRKRLEELGVLAFVEVRFGDQSGQAPERFERAIQGHDEILSCHEITCSADYMLTVVARDLESYGQFIEKVVRRQPGVMSIQSSLALREVKASARLPV